MKNIKFLKMFLAMLPVIAALALAPSTASAEMGFVSDSGKAITTVGSGGCLHTVRWESSMGECGAAPMAEMSKCPGTPEGVAVDADGCPVDSDADGVGDYEDICPGTPKGNWTDTRGCENIKKITVGHVNFDFDRATLKSSADSILNSAADQIKRNSAAVKGVSVTGYTDTTGPEAYNQALSERRANAVKGFLEGKGVTGITATGAGESNPVGDNGTRAGRAANRRVEIDVKM